MNHQGKLSSVGRERASIAQAVVLEIDGTAHSLLERVRRIEADRGPAQYNGVSCSL